MMGAFHRVGTSRPPARTPVQETAGQNVAQAKMCQGRLATGEYFFIVYTIIFALSSTCEQATVLSELWFGSISAFRWVPHVSLESRFDLITEEQGPGFELASGAE